MSMVRLYAIVSIAAALCVSSSIAYAKSDETATLKAPATWLVVRPTGQTETTSFNRQLGVWYAPSGASITLQQQPRFDGTPSEAVESIRHVFEGDGLTIVTDRQQKICNDRGDGWFFESTFVHDSVKFHTYQVFAFGEKHRYLATYSISGSELPDERVIIALRSLCVIPSS